MEIKLSFLVTLVVLVLFFMFFEILIGRTKQRLLKKAKNKRQISNIKFFARSVSFLVVVLVLFFVFFTYFESWTGAGVFLGLITAGLGFALQRPITGVAAWMMMIIKRPFNIGDRIIIGDVRGDVYDITLTHIYLDEVGGGVSSNETTGRNILIPNYLFFEQNIINYTLTNEFVLCTIDVSITYESDLDKAIKIIEDVAKKRLDEIEEKNKDTPYTRISMADSSMIVALKFMVPAKKMTEVKSKITKDIYDLIKKEKNVEIAYPHTEIIFKDKKFTK